MSLLGELLPWLSALVALTWLLPRRAVAGATLVLSAAALATLDARALVAVAALGLASHALLATPTRARAAATVVGAVVAFVVTKLDVTLGDGRGTTALLGMAFCAVRVIHVARERRAGRLGRLGLVAHLEYIFFLPLYVAGPIQRAEDHARDGARRRFDPGLLATGMERILYGAVKIIVLGAWAGWHLDVARQQLAPGSLAAAYLACVSYGWHLYFQFAGWSDVAIGFANLVGRRPPENFHFPFLARSPADFWTRWHASLSAWCRTTIYEPVAAHTRSAPAGVVASLLVLGLWHELSLRYLAWAAWHALAVVAGGRLATARRRRAAQAPEAPRRPWATAAATVAGIAVTQHVVILGFAFTSAPDLATGARTFLRLLTGGLVHV